MKLAILAAGIGSRFGGVKQLASIGPAGETLPEYNIYHALEAGFDSLVFLIRKDIEQDFREIVLARLPGDIPVELAFQYPEYGIPAGVAEGVARAGRTKPWGTGHALLCMREALSGGSFAVINADDFYGRRGFAGIHAYLAANPGPGPGGEARFCLAGYKLGGVVPPGGSVSRAICSVDAAGFLTKITEHTHIEQSGGELRSTWPDGRVETLSPDLPASMNIWGLTPAIFPALERRFGEFLEDAGHWGKAEFYLPAVVGGMIAAGQASARALSVDEEYFGLTNPEDLRSARRAVAERTARGDYPTPLWRGRAPAGRAV
jgi:hypothetical protein